MWIIRFAFSFFRFFFHSFSIHSIADSHVFGQVFPYYDRVRHVLQLVFRTDAGCQVFKQDIQCVIALAVGLLADRGEDRAVL